MTTKGIKIKGAILEIEVFKKFVKMYKDRYGEQKMGQETVATFYNEVCGIDTDQFFAVTTMLLGNQKFSFTWIKVIEKVAIMYPTMDNQLKLDKKWKLNYEQAPDKSKREQHAKILSCIPDMVQNNRKSWRIDYFKLIYDLLGHEECMEIALKIEYQFPEFKDYLYSRGKTI